jgi:hypothetical protein
MPDNRPGVSVHSEPWVSEATGIPYLIEIRQGRSGLYYGCHTAQEGPNAGREFSSWPPKRTLAGAIGHAKRAAAAQDDLTDV